eukprot:3582256-Rhodomonas_salina.1
MRPPRVKAAGSASARARAGRPAAQRLASCCAQERDCRRQREELRFQCRFQYIVVSLSVIVPVSLDMMVASPRLSESEFNFRTPRHAGIGERDASHPEVVFLSRSLDTMLTWCGVSWCHLAVAVVGLYPCKFPARDSMDSRTEGKHTPVPSAH